MPGGDKHKLTVDRLESNRSQDLVFNNVQLKKGSTCSLRNCSRAGRSTGLTPVKKPMAERGELQGQS
jgi:hypothetical protein